jgi:hypothetical protein
MKKIQIHLALGAMAMTLAMAAPATAQVRNCDRDCLVKLADDYFDALVAKDPSRVPLARDVRFVEQAKRLRPGEGLWKNTTGGVNPDYKLVVPDPVAQQVAGIVMMQAEGKPAQVGFRLKLENGQITEAEHLVAFPREQFMANLTKARPQFMMEVPYEYADSRGRLLHIAKLYYPALDWNNGSLAPFAPDCERLENGMRTAPNGGPLAGPGVPGQAPRPPSLRGMHDCTSQINSQTFQYIDSIDNVRVEIADEKLGLVVGFSHFRHSMKQKTFPVLNDPDRTSQTMDFEPFDLPAMHVYKIWGGQIHQIEAIGFTTGYNSPTGWE